jgi:hypothetical protein
MYEGLLDTLNRVVFIPTNNIAKGRFIQAGISEKGMLCSKCDNEILGNYERYSAGVLYNGKGVGQLKMNRLISHDRIKSVGLSNLDYSKFKLFILSVLWRAHHSKNSFFSKINIDQHENTIREMLLQGNSGLETEYKIGVVALKGDDGNLIRIMPDPETRKDFASFFINGFIYFIDLDFENGFKMMKTHYLRQIGELEIPIIEGELRKNFLSAFGLPSQVVNTFYQP